MAGISKSIEALIERALAREAQDRVQDRHAREDNQHREAEIQRQWVEIYLPKLKRSLERAASKELLDFLGVEYIYSDGVGTGILRTYWFGEAIFVVAGKLFSVRRYVIAYRIMGTLFGTFGERNLLAEPWEYETTYPEPQTLKQLSSSGLKHTLSLLAAAKKNELLGSASNPA